MCNILCYSKFLHFLLPRPLPPHLHLCLHPEQAVREWAAAATAFLIQIKCFWFVCVHINTCLAPIITLLHPEACWKNIHPKSVTPTYRHTAWTRTGFCPSLAGDQIYLRGHFWYAGLAYDCARNPQISEEKPQRDKWLDRRDRPFHIEWCWSFNCSHWGLVLSPACVTYGCKHESRMTASFAWLTFAIIFFSTNPKK